MQGLKEKLLQEQNRLLKIKESVEAEYETLPEGKLRISKSRNTVQYYKRDGSKKNGSYIPAAEHNLAINLAQKGYDGKVLELVETRLKQINQILRNYEEDEIEHIFSQLSVERKKLVAPVEDTWEMLLEQWINEEYQGKPFAEESLVIYTEKGERVRSKSEKIIADYLHHHGIPYKYEKPLYLQQYGRIHPDFTLLSRRTRQEVFWEHAGRMDEPDYAKDAVKRIKAYEKNGIYMGERLIVTFETQNCILNTSEIQSICQRML